MPSNRWSLCLPGNLRLEGQPKASRRLAWLVRPAQLGLGPKPQRKRETTHAPLVEKLRLQGYASLRPLNGVGAAIPAPDDAPPKHRRVAPVHRRRTKAQRKWRAQGHNLSGRGVSRRIGISAGSIGGAADQYVGRSVSQSVRVSQSQSESVRVSQSQSESVRVSQSQSESVRVSQSQSGSVRVSQSQSESVRVSQSESVRVSQSQSVSQSESVRVSQPASQSQTVCHRQSQTDSYKQTVTNRQSQTDSHRQTE